MVFALGCERWNETADVSHISYLPEFELTGGEFLSFKLTDSEDFTDPGAKATVNGESVNVFSLGTVNLAKEGIYIISYFAENSDGLSNTARRIVAVREHEPTNIDLTGKYETSQFGSLVEMKVTQEDTAGYYKCSDIMGFPGVEVEGYFVDFGENDLILVQGDSDFGRYASAEGAYSTSALIWSIEFLDEPNEGVTLDVVWSKVKN
jgi:hypothetical protein